MSTRVCGRCRRPLPAPATEGAAPAPCPFCAAQDAGRAAAAPASRAQPARPPADAAAGKKRAEAFASALAENASRTTPVHSFAVPPEAIPVVNQPRRREPPPPPTPPPIFVAPPPPPEVEVIPAPPVAPSQPAPRRAAAVTATLASLGHVPVAPQARASSPAAAAAVVAAPSAVAVAAPPSPAPAASLAAAFTAAPTPVVAPSPHLVSVPPSSPASVAPAPVARAAPPAASLAATMLGLSPPLSESRNAPETPRAAASAEGYEGQRGAAAPAERGADAWNIGAYLDNAGAAGSPAPPALSPTFAAPGAADAQPAMGSEPVDLQIRSGLSLLLDRLRQRGIAVAAGAALLVAVIGAGAFVLLGGPLRSGAGKPGAATASVAPAVASRVSAVLATGSQLPSLVMPKMTEPSIEPAAPAAASPKIEKAEKTAKARAPEPEAAPPAVEEEAPIAAAPARSPAHSEAKSRSVSKHAAHHAAASSSSRRTSAHRRTTAHAGALDHGDSDVSESDKIARARDAYREGNQRLFSGDAGGAITAYEEMVRLNPKDPAGYRGLGLASAQLGKRTEAVRYLRSYLKHAPNADDRAIIIGRISLLQTLPP